MFTDWELSLKWAATKSLACDLWLRKETDMHVDT